MTALNALLAWVNMRVKLQTTNEQATLRVYPRSEDGVVFVVLVQVVGSDDTQVTVALGCKCADGQCKFPVTFVSRYTNCTEDSATSLAALISVCRWAVHHLRYHTVTASSLEVICQMLHTRWW